MKKILLIMLASFMTISAVNANRDRVTTVVYKANVNMEIPAYFELIDKSCGDFKTHKYNKEIGNVFSILTNGNRNSCTWNGTKLLCTATRNGTRIAWIVWKAPENSINEEIKLCAKQKDILKNMWVNAKIADKYTAKVCINYTLKMNLVVDSSNYQDDNRSMFTETKESIDLWSLEFTDNTSCKSCQQTCKMVEKDEKQANGTKKKVLKQECKPERLPSSCGIIRGRAIMPELPKSAGKYPWQARSIGDDWNTQIGDDWSTQIGDDWSTQIGDDWDVTTSVVSNPTWDIPTETITITGNKGKNLDDHKESPKLGEIKLDDCRVDNGIYYCYATDSLKFQANLKKKGANPEWVTNYIISVLNKDSTDQIGKYKVEVGDYTHMKEVWLSMDIIDNKRIFSKTGEYVLEVQGVYDKDNKYNSTDVKYIKIHIVPNPVGLKGEIIAQPTPSNDKYANYSDKYTYTYQVKDKYGNIINDKSLTKLECEGGENICASTKEESKQHSIYIEPKTQTLDKEGKSNFTIKSAVPWNFTPNFKGALKKWDRMYKEIADSTDFSLISNQVIFNEPITFEEMIVWDWNSDMGIDMSKTQTYTLSVQNKGKLTSFSSGKLVTTGQNKLQETSFKFSNNNHKFKDGLQNKKNNLLLGKLKTTFQAIVTSKTDDDILKKIDVTPKDIDIKYSTRGDKTYAVRYPLNTSYTNICEAPRIWVKIEGFSQGIGKVSETGEQDAYTDISVSETRSQIRKNIYALTRNLKNKDIVNGIHYYEGDQKSNIIINNMSSGDTLVIKNGSLTIDNNITGKNIGIVVLKDNYQVSNSSKEGNIYITPGVTEINAVIYADGALMTDAQGKDESQLRERLNITWSIFTRNTIGWAEKWSTGCKLPGGKTTIDCDLAMKYDLNHLRKTIICKPDEYSLKIKYNDAVRTNPPKGFAN